MKDTNAVYCLNPPPLTMWDQGPHRKQRRVRTSWTGTWLGPLFSILTHCLCSCKGGTCSKKRNTVSGAILHEGRGTPRPTPPPEGGQMCFLIHSFAHATHLFILFYKYLSRIYSVPALLSILENPALNQWLLLELTF